MESSRSDELRSKKCVPCETGGTPLTDEETRKMLAAVPGWDINGTPCRLVRAWVTRNFMAAIDFFNRIAALAEQEGHHPDLHLTGYRNVTVEIMTHAIGGLSENDFILAAKIDALSVELKPARATH